jgi:ATP-dependent DNA helicase RecG
MYTWTTPVRYIKTIGPARAKELVVCGIETVGDLLEKQPLSYIYPGAMDIADAKEGMVVVKGRITSIKQGWGSTVVADLDDDTGSCEIVWYYASYVMGALHNGMTATFYGKLKGGVLQQPKWTTVESTMENIYGGQYGVHHNTIRAALKEVLANVELPRMSNGTSRKDWFNQFHFPANKHAHQHASRMFKQDEALQLQLALAERRRGSEGVTVEPWEWDMDHDTKVMSYFKYKFTDDQHDACINIYNDVADLAVRPMQRLIHGEVGSGKTSVAFYAAMMAALEGKRTLILCPTTILAQQHYDTLRGMGWDDCQLYTDSKKWSLSHKIIIGTHALLNPDFPRKLCSLVIIDEFQKFGVEQRAKIQRHHPHLLLMSATPIPRTLAATVFGDLDVSTIKELPIKRGTVVTKWVLPEKREAMYEIIERELAKGHQAYVVCPRIDGDEDVVSVEREYVELFKRFGSDARRFVDMLTGRDTPAMKAYILHNFREGSTKILVSTTIAEVGLDNSNATVMCIMGADRFGLSSLHQMRGRICRSTSTAFCFLVSETANPTSIARLEVIERTNDGFEIAEEDLRLRGAGEVFSTRQTGLPDLRWCSLVDDYDLMVSARETVSAGSVGSGVMEMMRLRYGDSLELGGVV